jgi:hypothetical protein
MNQPAAETPEQRAAKVEAMRDSLTNHPDLLARFNEIHPVPVPGPTTLELALAARSVQAAVGIQSVGPWYGVRHKLLLTCTQEHRLEAFMHRLL